MRQDEYFNYQYFVLHRLILSILRACVLVVHSSSTDHTQPGGDCLLARLKFHRFGDAQRPSPSASNCLNCSDVPKNSLRDRSPS